MIRTYSLNIGVNRVSRESYKVTTSNDLKGCHDDARLMAAIAREKGFEREPVILLDHEATYSNVIDKVNEAVEYLREGGMFMWTFSGHGTKLPPGGNNDGSYDEGWVLYDRILIDNCVRAMLARFDSRVTAIVVSDCCFSQGIIPYRGILSRRGRVTARSFPPATKFLSQNTINSHRKKFENFYTSHSCPYAAARVEDVKAAVIAISACGESETTKDSSFTPLLVEMIRSSGMPLRGYDDLIDQMKNKLGSQNPGIKSMGRYDDIMMKGEPFAMPVKVEEHMGGGSAGTARRNSGGTPPRKSNEAPNRSPGNTRVPHNEQPTNQESRSMADNPITFEPAQNSYRSPTSSFTVIRPMSGEIITSADGMFRFEAITSNFDIGATVKTSGIPPCALEPWDDKGGGQHIYLIIDDDHDYRIYAPGTEVQLRDLTTGIHVLRAYLSRSWEESLKGTAENQLFCIREFYYQTRSGVPPYNRALPLLSLNAPLASEDADEPYMYDDVPLDFFFMFQQPIDGYGVEVMLYDRTMELLAHDTLTEWAPHCIKGLPKPATGAVDDYTLRVRVVDHLNVPVPQGINGVDFNTIVRPFRVWS